MVRGAWGEGQGAGGEGQGGGVHDERGRGEEFLVRGGARAIGWSWVDKRNKGGGGMRGEWFQEGNMGALYEKGASVGFVVQVVGTVTQGWSERVQGWVLA
jgi:hypothetical protein